MNLSIVTGHPIRLTCIKCQRHGESNSTTWFADLDGEPFKAYYCRDCADTLHLATAIFGDTEDHA